MGKLHIVMPAKAGLHDFTPQGFWGVKSWITAFAGMTMVAPGFNATFLRALGDAYSYKSGHNGVAKTYIKRRKW